MSCKMMRWEWFCEISDHDQEVLCGGKQPQISNDNFFREFANTTQTNNTGRLGNLSQKNTNFGDVNSGANSILSSDLIRVSPLGNSNKITADDPLMFNNPLGLFV